MLSSHIPFCFALPRVHTCTFHTSHHLDSMVAFLMVHIWFWHYHQHFQCNYILHNQRDTMTPQSKFDWFKHHLYLIKTSVQNQLPLTRSFWFTPFLVCTSPPVELLLFCKLDSCHVKLEKLVQIYLSIKYPDSMENEHLSSTSCQCSTKEPFKSEVDWTV